LRFLRADLKEFKAQPDLPVRLARLVLLELQALLELPELQGQRGLRELKDQPVLHRLLLIPTFRMRYH
jgi:hypothetical protein